MSIDFNSAKEKRARNEHHRQFVVLRIEACISQIEGMGPDPRILALLWEAYRTANLEGRGVR